ncbi:MAG: hypothetical protein LDLANPLL_00837 [Turneriella sp.]|nr:hypothetical protein [Turneriella sp.]
MRIRQQKLIIPANAMTICALAKYNNFVTISCRVQLIIKTAPRLAKVANPRLRIFAPKFFKLILISILIL